MRRLLLILFLLPGKTRCQEGLSGHRPPSFPEHQPVAIYLSFDDGPCEGSEEVARLAALDSIAVNVFIIGRRAVSTDSMRALFRRYQENVMVEIGNHSFSHANRKYHRYYQDASDVLADFNANRDSLHLENNIARMPGRNYWRIGRWRQDDIVNGKEAADSLASHGYRVFGWDLEWRSDTATGHSFRTAQQMADSVESMLRIKRTFKAGHLVILLHDPQLQDAGFREELSSFIKIIKAANRYHISHLSSYPLR